MSLGSKFATGFVTLATTFGMAGCANIQAGNEPGYSCGGLQNRDATGLGAVGGMAAGAAVLGPIGAIGGAVVGSVAANNASTNCSYSGAPAYRGYIVH
jgi:hypothetical protein